MSQNELSMDKLSELLGAKITVVDAVPTSTRDNRVSAYRMLFNSIAPGTTRRLEYDDKKSARIKYSIARGHCTRNPIETSGYTVGLRGSSIFVTNGNKPSKK